MPENLLSVFTNFRINDEERFLRMKDSFHSFKDINATKWIINVRGKYQVETLSFLKEHLGEKLSAHKIESGKGWFHDSRLLLSELESDFVLYWIEDHINMVPVEKYSEILGEMKESRSQFLFTSWWFFDQAQNAYEGLKKESYENIDTIEIDLAGSRTITEKVGLHFIISALGLFQTQLFKKVINTNHPILRRWPKETPFDIEKRITDRFWLPIRISLPKYEVFAPIDDDLRGYPGSLQSRGLYPLRVLRDSGIPQQSAREKRLKKCYEQMPAWLRWGADNLILKPYYNLRQLLRRLSYHI